MDFPPELAIPQKAILKRGAARTLAGECRVFGSRGVIVHGASLEANGKLAGILAAFPEASAIGLFRRRTSDEPDLGEISEVIAAARRAAACWIAGIGGGSVLDLAKAAAGLYNAAEGPGYYQAGGVLQETGIPFVAVPTTAGTGSEATVNAVIVNKEKMAKLSIRDRSFLARTVILDAELLAGLPREAMSYAAMDAFVQSYESFISKNATPDTEALALKAMALINANIIPAYETSSPDNLEGLLLGSYLCGAAFNASRLGVIHGLAHPLGVLYHEPHGLVCAVLLEPSIRINRDAMGRKYDAMSETVGGDFLARAAALLKALRIASPFKGRAVVREEQMIDEALRSGSTAANPKPVSRDDVVSMLKAVF